MSNLAFIIEKYFPFGGLQRDMHRFARACADAGHCVTIFTSHWEGPPDETLKVERVNFHATSNHQTIKNIERFVQQLQEKKQFDCIIGFNRVNGLDVYFGGDPCLKAKLQKNNRYWLRFLPRYRTYLQMEAAVFGPQSTADILLISPTEMDHIQKHYQTDRQRLHLLPPGIDRERITANPLQGQARINFRNELGITKNELLILTIGSHFHTKGIDRAITAIAALPEPLKKNCKYVVVGNGDEKQFQKLANQAGIGSQISFTGGRTDVGNFYYAADLLLHLARTETAGHTLLESMMTALPVLVTEVCGYARYVQEAKGGQLTDEPFNQHQLNAQLNEMLANEPGRSQYGKNGQSYCDTADIYSMTAKAIAVILNRAQKNQGAK